MKINRIELVNFSNHQDTRINLDHINVFVGRNNSGKSSIKAAIEYALTGRCEEGTDRAGRGAEALVRHGASFGGVTLNVEGLGDIARAVPGELQVAGWQGGTKLQQAQLYQELGAGADVISAAINTGNFLKLSPDEQKNVLFKLMGLTFDEQSMTEALEKYLTKTKRHSILEASFYGFLKMFTSKAGSGGPEVLDTVYNLVYKERTGAKKALKELETLAAGGKQESALPPGAFESREQIREDLAKLKDRKEELLQLRGQALGKKDLVERLTAESKRLSLQYEDLYAELEAIEFNQAELDELEATLPELEKKAEGTRNNWEVQLKIVNNHKANLDSWTSAREKLSGNQHDRLCPIAPKLQCSADIKAMLEQLGRDIDACAKLYDDALQEATIMEQEAKEAAERYQQALARVEDLRRADQRMKDLAKDIQDVDNARESVRAELEQAEKSIVSLTEVEEEMDQLSQRIPKGEELLRQIAAEERVREERNHVAGALERKRQEVAWLEVLVEAFGPKGMKAAMLAEVVGKVQAHANERLAILGGGKYSLEFSTVKDFEVLVKVDGHVTRKLSKSERMRVDVILQDVLNSLTGLRLLVIDDCDTLDPVNKGMLINLLLQVRDDYDTIIILSALGETQPRNPGIPGLSMFMVENVAVRAIPAPAVA
jgi:prefoldin subunit 5